MILHIFNSAVSPMLDLAIHMTSSSSSYCCGDGLSSLPNSKSNFSNTIACKISFPPNFARKDVWSLR